MKNDDLKLTISTGRSRKETDWRVRHTTWGKLAEKLSAPQRTKETAKEYAEMTRDERALAKDVGGFVGGEIADGARKGGNVRSRCLLSLDIDYGELDTWDAYEMMCDWECLMHTTHSHTPEKPRYRMFFPLSRPVSKEEYEPLGRMVAKSIDIELFDDTTYQSARLMYWPSCPQDGEFKVWRHEGRLIDPDEVLGYYTDWRDRREWPSSKRTKIEIHQQADRQESPLRKKGIVGAFCRVYDIPSAIERYLPDVYTPNEHDDTRYTFTGGSTSNGLRLYGDHGNEKNPPWVFCYSEHDTDPAHGRNLNAFDLVRWHKCPPGNRDSQEEEERRSYEAMKALALEDEAVRREFDRMTESSSPDTFDDPRDTLLRMTDDYSEQGNAVRLKDLYYTRMRYSPSMDWCVWDGEIWQTNAQHLGMLNAMNLADRWHDEAERALQLAPHPEKGQRKQDWPEEYKAALALEAWARQCRGYNNLNHTLTAARTIMSIDDANEFDRDPWKLNTPAGIVDLTTGAMLPHDAEEMCTKMTAVSPDAALPCPRWQGFLRRVTGGDEGLIRYLQDIAGMALVGKVYEEGLVIAYGPGGNGKSTLFEIWKRVMGDYAGTVRNEVIMGGRNGGEVAGQEQLRGLRLVITSELEENEAMRVSQLKRLTSRDDISCNVKYHAPITFTPTHTLVMHTNHLPKLRSVDEGTRRRLSLVPFLAQIPPGEKVADFAGEVLKEEAGAVLAWMIEGAVRFHAAGMKITKPDAVLRESDEFIAEADIIGQFLEDCCDVGDAFSESPGDLFRKYRDWAEEAGAPNVLNFQTFPRAMRARGYEYRSKWSDGEKKKRVCGVRLKSGF